MAKEQANLKPEEQATLFQLMKKAGLQPTSGGRQPTAQEAPIEEPPMPAPGAFKNDPQGAVNYIASRFAGQLNRNQTGQLTYTQPHSNPLFRLFGAKQTGAITNPDFYSTVQQSGLEQFLPSGLMKTPEGTPYVGPETLEKVRQAAASVGKQETPSPALAKAFLKRIKNVVEPEVFTALEEDISQKGLLPSKLGEYNATFGLTRKEWDIHKLEDGKVYKIDRASGEVQPILGAAQGVLSTFNPVELALVKVEMKGFDTDKVVTEVKTQVKQLGDISALVESRNPASLGILASNIAKGLGREAGVLTEGDIARATGSQQLGDRWKRFWSKHTTGQLSDVDVQDFRKLITEINSTAQKQIGAVAKQRAGRLSQILKRPVEELIPVISYGVDFIPTEDKGTPTQDSVTTAARIQEPAGGQTKRGTKYRVIQE